jgi:Sulfotransferase domain
MSARSIRRAGSLLLAGLQSVLGALAGVLYQLCILTRWFKFRLDFNARPDDVFIVTYPRSGTTWMQMILYQLATDGSMEFDHISQRVPFFERMFLSGRDPDALASPRIFKSHLPWRGGLRRHALLGIPKSGGRYIYVVRNPGDVAVSYYHFHRTHLAYAGTFERFLAEFIAGKVLMGSWFCHVAEWRTHADSANVLFLKYEDLTHDLERCIRRIAAFCGFDVSAEQWPRIIERCSFAFMKQHEAQFDHLTETLIERGQKLHAFLRTGRAGEASASLTAEQADAFKRQAQRWQISEYLV